MQQFIATVGQMTACHVTGVAPCDEPTKHQQALLQFSFSPWSFRFTFTALIRVTFIRSRHILRTDLVANKNEQLAGEYIAEN